MTAQRISVFPLAGGVLYPGLQLPLHIFEQRYRSMISDAMARDRQIGMIQPRAGDVEDNDESPPLFSIGCLGRIADVEALDDGRYNILLEGIARFRLLRELDVTTPFRQVEADILDEPQDEVLASIERAGLEREAQKFAKAQGYSVDWDAVSRLDDMSFVNGVSQIAPFDVAAKQALIESNSLQDRADLLIQLLQFFGRHDSDDPHATLQ